MKHRSSLALFGILVLGASLVFAQSSKEEPKSASKPPAAQGKQELPPGMTEADMKACAEAGTPGPKHEFLAQSIGVWSSKNTMWMTPTAEPVKTDCTATYTAVMDGRF